MHLCPVKTSSLLEFGVREEKAPDICPVQCLLSGAVTTVRRSSRPLEMDGWCLKKGHVDGQRPPDRGHRTGGFVRCIVRCPRADNGWKGQRLYLIGEL